MRELFEIQQRFKSGKNQLNEFGGFKYRNLESMLADLKPILNEYQCTITFNDDMINLGDRYYLKATATLTNKEGISFSTTAFAREDLTHKGMCESQVTGCSSSYSRKYALCGLLAVNEEIDVDSLDNRPSKPTTPSKPIQQPQTTGKSNLENLTEFCHIKKQEQGINVTELTRFFDYYKTKINQWSGTLNLQNLWDKWNTDGTQTIKPKKYLN